MNRFDPLRKATPTALLSRLRPPVLVLAGDEEASRLAEGALVRGWGGHVVALPFVDDAAAPPSGLRAGGHAAGGH